MLLSIVVTNLQQTVTDPWRINYTVGEGRRQNSSAASGDFLQRMTNVGW